MWPFTRKQTHPIFGEIHYLPRKKRWKGKYEFPKEEDFLNGTIEIPGDENGPIDITAWWAEFMLRLPELCAQADTVLRQGVIGAPPLLRNRILEAVNTFSLGRNQVSSVEIPASPASDPWCIGWAYPLSRSKEPVVFAGTKMPTVYGVLKFEYREWAARRVLNP